ncbi:hypothetical protein NUW58_g6628 [Xylaria curta]|uniref:Uncharacterized protein n=1 Tax=Xylaria curta TaxID=42375 RepID=A0ACC1NRH4_9PEZI|nr:hypothetical protein NUW58_g6628 [Xylaria curta]
MATITDFSVDLVVPAARFGSVCGGFLDLKSMMRPVSDCVRLSLDYRIVGDWYDEEFLANVAEGIEFIPDTEEDGAAIEAIFKGVKPGRPLFLVNLWWGDREVTNPFTFCIRAIGLVVAPSDSIQEAFSRVGMFRIAQDKHTTSLVDGVPPAAGFDLGNFFSSYNSRLLRLV